MASSFLCCGALPAADGAIHKTGLAAIALERCPGGLSRVGGTWAGKLDLAFIRGHIAPAGRRTLASRSAAFGFDAPRTPAIDRPCSWPVYRHPGAPVFRPQPLQCRSPDDHG